MAKKKADAKEEILSTQEAPSASGKDDDHEYAESIINTVREPLIALDQDLRVVSVSRSFYSFFKVKPKDTVGQLIYDLGNKQWDIPKLRELLETILPQKASFDNYEVEHNFTAIGRRIMLLNARQILRGVGKERIILLAIEDITKRKDAEAGLERTRKELEVIKKSADEALEYAESIINTVREPLIIMDQNLRVVTASRSFYGFFKVDSEETVGQLIYDLGNKQWDIPKLRELLETILPQKASFDNYEVEHVFTAIGRRIMLLNARQIQRGAEKERIILLAIEDITERKLAENELKKHRDHLEELVGERTKDLLNSESNLESSNQALHQSEEQLRQAQKMEAVGRLAGGIAHDFNNMLTVINNYAEFVIAELRPGDPLRSDIEEILKAGRRSADLTRQLLAFSRRQVLAPEILDINKIVAGIEPMLKRLIGEDIDFTTYAADNLGKVKADPGQIEQVILNIAVNSRDAMPKGGKLTIETHNVELDEEYATRYSEVTPGQYVMMSITDTGCGMDAQIIEHIFEPFFTTKEVGKGTGLGLSTVYGIIKQSGGHICIYSEPGKGTTFKVHLPRELSDAESVTREKRNNKPTTGTETILVVEDEPAVRNLTKRVLEAAGYTVHTAASGGEAFLTCERIGDSIQLMITDIVMPEMSGRELAERLAKICPDMKVLYMSGYTEDAIVRHGVLDHDTAFISKPFSLPDLKIKVREVLDK